MMRRRAKPAKAKVEAKLPVARKSQTSEGSRVNDLEKRLAEALEQQTATDEILGVIASSPPDVREENGDKILTAELCGRRSSSCAAFDRLLPPASPAWPTMTRGSRPGSSSARCAANCAPWSTAGSWTPPPR
jgi:hypothetical protein